MNPRILFLALLISVFFTGLSSQVKCQVVVNEYSCSNLSQYLDNYAKYEDWFELYNSGSATVNLAGYYLSDDSVSNMKWLIPNGVQITSHGFLRFWASGRDEVSGSDLHTNFKLTQTKSTKEFIVLSNPSGVFVDYIKLTRKTQLGHSFGRTQNGLSLWSLFTTPTPNASNNTSTPYFAYADKPNASMPAGYYSGSVAVALVTTENNADIHYTTDGTVPTIYSPIYTVPLTFTTTTVLKSRTYSTDPEILPSFVQFETYFINVSHTTVVVSISGTDVNTLANGNSSLEPHGTFEYFDLNHVRTAKTYGEFDRHGQDSWANSQRSLDFISRDEMGYNHSIAQQMFNWTARDQFQRVILRAAGDDNYPADHHAANLGSAHLRDAYFHSLADIGGMDLDVRRSEKCVVYLNGQYWGVYDIRERPDDHDYTEYYYGQDKYHIQYNLLWGSTWAEYGGQQSLDDWHNFYDWIMAHNMANQTDFDYVTQRLDWVSLADYVISNSLSVCSDWLNWNVGWWRGIDSTGGHLRWGYILWDNDATWGHYINYTGIPNTTPSALPCAPEGLTGSSDPEGHIVLLNRLRQNPGFNQFYISRQIDLWNTVFSLNNMISQLDSTVAIIDPEMTMHAARWNGTYTEWKQNVQTLRNYIIQRNTNLVSGFINCYSLNGPYQVVVKTDPPNTGTVMLNSLALLNYPWTGTYFGGVATKLRAIANPGYTFDHWSSNNQVFAPGSNDDSVSFSLSSNDTIIAHFAVSSAIPEFPKKQSGPVISVNPSFVGNSTVIEYLLPNDAPVKMELLSTTGTKVLLVQEQQNMLQGKHSKFLDLGATNLSSGVYLLEFTSGSFRKTVKLVYAPH